METETTPLQRVRVFEAFRHRDFRVLWSGQVVSLIGDAAFFTTLGWRAFTLVGSSRLGIVFVAQGIGLLTTLRTDIFGSGQVFILDKGWSAFLGLVALDVWSGRRSCS